MQRSLGTPTSAATVLASAAREINQVNGKIGVCSKCSVSQRLDKCAQQLSAKLLVIAGDKSHTVVAFIPIIHQITKDHALTDLTNPDLTNPDELTTQLLMSDPFSTTYTPNNVINAVYHNKSVDRWPPTLHHIDQTSAFFLRHFCIIYTLHNYVANTNSAFNFETINLNSVKSA